MAWRVGAAAAEAAPRSMAEARRGVSGVECSREGDVDGVSPPPLMPTIVSPRAAELANAEGVDREGRRPSASPPDTTWRGAIQRRRREKNGRSLKGSEARGKAREVFNRSTNVQCFFVSERARLFFLSLFPF